ncbi:Non-specific lipid-transfer protein [Geodia barretti]|uniref:Sterol carrier protein 2 n=2 Tax=Geodia barretti TaxID=519541 RepID=A0AA35XBC2_GEOBA|nr:Non-specific lipid-transfer protein [Geodia barretti]
MTGIPIYNVNNACSTGSSALLLAKQLVEGGSADCVMALGFEKMERGSLMPKYTDRTSPMDRHVDVLANTHGIAAAPITPQMFASAGKEHMQKYGTTAEHMAKIAWKNHKHSVNNPNSQFRKEYSLDEIRSSRMVHEPLTMLQCCPTSDGSACAILCSEEFAKKHGLTDKAVEILAIEMATDLPSTFSERSCMKMVGYDMTRMASDKAYKKAGLCPRDVQVVELHDCFSANELISYEALGLCQEGRAGEMVDHGNNTYGGKYVVNPSGGLISKGHPLGATGLAQCAELCWQLRGEAGKRQVPGAKVGLQHNIGLGGAVVVALYRLGYPSTRSAVGMAPAGGSSLQCDPVFDLIAEKVKEEGASMVKKIKGSFLFKIKGSDGKVYEWLVDLKSPPGSVTKGTGLKGNCTIAMTDSNFMDLVTGKIGAQKAFFEGKLKISGNTALALKLQTVMPKPGQAKL